MKTHVYGITCARRHPEIEVILDTWQLTAPRARRHPPGNIPESPKFRSKRTGQGRRIEKGSGQEQNPRRIDYTHRDGHFAATLTGIPGKFFNCDFPRVGHRPVRRKSSQDLPPLSPVDSNLLPYLPMLLWIPRARVGTITVSMAASSPLPDPPRARRNHYPGQIDRVELITRIETGNVAAPQGRNRRNPKRLLDEGSRTRANHRKPQKINYMAYFLTF
jgi:hypothetical protein